MTLIRHVANHLETKLDLHPAAVIIEKQPLCEQVGDLELGQASRLELSPQPLCKLFEAHFVLTALIRKLLRQITNSPIIIRTTPGAAFATLAFSPSPDKCKSTAPVAPTSVRST